MTAAEGAFDPNVEPISLSERVVDVAAHPALLFEVIAAGGETLEERSATEKIVRFTARVGRRTVETTEVVRLTPPGSIRYTWIEGPLPFVEEEIRVEPTAGGARLRYEGRFATSGGRVRRSLAKLFVRPPFERAIARHLAEAKAVAEARAARSKLYPRRGT